MIRRVLPLTAALVCAFSCATVKTPDVEELKPTVEAFHQRVRWKDFRGAAELIVPERRDGFVKGRSRLNDDRDLFITDFQLEDAQVLPSAQVASVVTRMSWYRLPDTTERNVTLTSIYAWRDGHWMLESQDEGPFEELRPAKGATHETPQTEVPSTSLRPGIK